MPHISLAYRRRPLTRHKGELQRLLSRYHQLLCYMSSDQAPRQQIKVRLDSGGFNKNYFLPVLGFTTISNNLNLYLSRF